MASGNCLSDIAKEVSSDLSAKRNRLHLLAMVSLGLVSTRGRTLSELKWSAHPADELMRGWLVPVQQSIPTVEVCYGNDFTFALEDKWKPLA